MAAASPFVEISKAFLDNLLDNSTPEKTKKAPKYEIKIFNGKFWFFLLFFLLLDKTTNFFYKFKTNSVSLFNVLSLFLL